ncbi:hypothetical protein [Flavobacterium covae]|uniref:hypothetical protein n=2 Tax=Flavobacterium covae TaxID=2906076 RepID=UPI000745B535|nr:hypothetical protein [Flavobacterium covae]AMA49869.1 hypothetical protein AWN65_10595 [Flavobacterium covae]AND64602.1 hypothetical protein AX766_09320 [Flavobacterium covae]MCJ1810215.1 hypothetical protein [Flavobacterium covae]
MERQFEKIYLKVESEGLFDENKTLYLLDLPNADMLKNIPVKPIKNELFVFARGYNEDLKIGSLFNVIFPSKNPNEYIENLIELKYVSVNPKYEIDYLPKGYSGICLLKFQNEIPNEILKKLAGYDEKKDNQKHDTLILTQKAGLKKLLKEIETLAPARILSRGKKM